jgi:16S rRNA G966 N2-methylase RsmD
MTNREIAERIWINHGSRETVIGAIAAALDEKDRDAAEVRGRHAERHREAMDCRGIIDCTGEVPVVRKVHHKTLQWNRLRNDNDIVFVCPPYAAESAAQRKEGEV